MPRPRSPSATPSTPSSPTRPKREVQRGLARARARCEANRTQLTDLRALVLELLLQRGKATKAYDLLADLSARQPGVAPMTVYRALDFLVEQHLVHKVVSTSSFVVCEHTDDQPHEDPVFLVCERCGSTTEWNDARLKVHVDRALEPTGFHAHGIEIKGECANCHAGK
jgi:Fur family zinc uptake transcriptional regulator